MRVERVVVTGGRHFADAARIEADLRALLPLGLRRVAHGDCPLGGADTIARNACWRIFGGDKVTDPSTGLLAEYPMRHDLDGPGRQAYLRRNERMLDAEKPDLVLAYPDPESRGTWHCVREALARECVVAIWTPYVVPFSEVADEIRARGVIGREFDVVSDVRRHVVGPARGGRLDLMGRAAAGVVPAELDAHAAVARALRGAE